MKTLKQIWNNVDYKDVEEVLIELYPNDIKNLKGFAHAFNTINAITETTDNEDIITIDISWVEDDIEPEKGEGWYHVCGLDKDNDTWSLSIMAWEEWLSKKVNKPAGMSDVEAVAHCLWEMTWHGFTQEEIKVFVEDLQKRIEEVESGEAKTIPWEDVKKKLFEIYDLNIDEES